MKGSDLTVRMLELRRKWEAAEDALSAQAEIISNLELDKRYLTARNTLLSQYGRWLEEQGAQLDPTLRARALEWLTAHDPIELEID